MSWAARSTGTTASTSAATIQILAISPSVYWRPSKGNPMSRNVLIGTSFVALLAALGMGQAVLDKTAAAQGKATVQAPRFEVDPLWPKPLPNHWIYGNVIGVSVDAQDHVYIIHRTDVAVGNLNAKEVYSTT